MYLQVERGEVLAQLSESLQKMKELEEEVTRYRDCDPEVMQQMKEESGTALDAANRWTGLSYMLVTVGLKRSCHFGKFFHFQDIVSYYFIK